MYQMIEQPKNGVNLQSFTCFRLLLIIKGFINTARAEEVKTYNLESYDASSLIVRRCNFIDFLLYIHHKSFCGG